MLPKVIHTGVSGRPGPGVPGAAAFRIPIPGGARLAAVLVAVALALIAEAAPAGTWEDAEAAVQGGDYQTAARLYRQLAQDGAADAQFNLGLLYYNGWGVAQSDSETAVWWRRSAEQGLARAQYNLGTLYMGGRGVPQDFAEGEKWWRQAAAQGNADARFNLGLTYLNGDGVSKDDVRAHLWFALAAERGDAEAKKYRDALEERMSPAEIAEAERLRREWLAQHP